MIPTLKAAGQWAVVPLAGVHMDFEIWMASFKFNKNAYAAVKGGADNSSAQSRPLRRSLQRNLRMTPPALPQALPLRRPDKSSHTSHSTLSPSSSSFSTSLTSSPSLSYITSETPPLCVTEFFEVRMSLKGGYGAFAIKDIDKGTLIISEKPLFRATYMEVFQKYEALSASQREDFRSLYGWKGISDHPILAIFKTNRFETHDGKGGIFLKSSRFNHACHPFSTCTYSYDNSQGRLIVKALRSIKASQEITISYCGTPWTLYDNYGFYCDCKACPPPAEARAQAAFFRGSE